MRKFAQLLLVEKVEFLLLVMMDLDYWLFKLCISINNKDKPRTGLIIKSVLGDTLSISAIKDVVSIFANKAFIDLIVRIMPEGKSQAKVVSLLNNDTFTFMYDIRITTPGPFSDPRLFHPDNFEADTSVAVEVQIYAQNFKPKRSNEYTCRYPFKLIEIYKIQDIPISPLSMPEKRQKIANK